MSIWDTFCIEDYFTHLVWAVRREIGNKEENNFDVIRKLLFVML